MDVAHELDCLGVLCQVIFGEASAEFESHLLPLND
jgi:hypothetical protein